MEITFLNFLSLCQKHSINVVSANYELDGRNRMTVELQISGKFPEIGEKLSKFIQELSPYLEDKFIHKYFSIKGGNLDLEKKDGSLYLEFFAKGIGLALDKESK